ncbi:carbamoyl-phosphate synthase, small subunit [Alkaliphilus metalliredigens QYMF]|uniref:Carbamoyl phosphate synthase small chain n=1 Tax=Alkaliphilus metalliredigens (strain QYMF) TaxID=293826 RepID=A6TTI9_ALKMQ|nr:carbamoyl phosphate synthase small subunit [Alkaliphilus metalliredigens]ABR49507.1 carbamoyl-phosphate synthase, small subunit [Alkaliphilus metalliredigens QYMF]
MKAYLLLEDGTIFEGSAFGSHEEKIGEVVFNTSMTGYQEIFTDYSYAGQTLVMTYPMIGNYGINKEDVESAKPMIRGLVVREFCKGPSNWKSEMTIEDYLIKNNIMGIEGIDTRMLVKHLRDHGTMKGIITKSLDDKMELIAKLKGEAALAKSFTAQVSTPKPYVIPGKGPKIALMDFGVKLNIIRILQSYGCEITILPYDTSADTILKMNVDGIFLSNGPGDPQSLQVAVKNIKKLMQCKPIFGICMGHQLLALASGAQTYKLKYGHRGANHPVKDLMTNKVYMTSQNHGYSVDEETIDEQQFTVTHKNLNDGTVEGLRHKYLPVFSVQYHPEAAPGPQESRYLFDQFLNLMCSEREAV